MCVCREYASGSRRNDRTILIIKSSSPSRAQPLEGEAQDKGRPCVLTGQTAAAGLLGMSMGSACGVSVNHPKPMDVVGASVVVSCSAIPESKSVIAGRDGGYVGDDGGSYVSALNIPAEFQKRFFW